MITKQKIFKTIREYLILTFASALFALCWESFMIPTGISAGGLMGLSTVVQFATGGVVKASVMYAVVNVFLILLAVLAFGIGFGVKTVYCIVLNSIMLELFGTFDFLMCLPGHFFYIREIFIVPIIAGVLEAVAVGLIIRYGGSTGGTDIIALMVNKYWPVELSKVFLATDLFIITLILFLPDKHFADMIYGLEQVVTFSLVVDLVVVGQRSTIQLMVFSEKREEIADFIIQKMDRGVTMLRAQGWFTKKERDVLLVLMQKKQLTNITKFVKSVDPNAFMSVTSVKSVYGEGFEEIKTGKVDNIKKIKKS